MAVLNRAVGIVVALLLNGCASEVVRYPANLEANTSPAARHYVLLGTTMFRLDSGYDRTIQSGTEFVEFGSITQGTVIKPTNTVLTVEGAHMHEAYPVFALNKIVGFYLPVEHAFSPVTDTPIVVIEERK